MHAARDDDEWDPPREFDGFVVVGPLGRGGMGAVHRGHDVALDRPVALKFVRAAEPDPRERERFLREARALARLTHPNVVQVFRVGEVEGNPYIAYEFVEGSTLHAMRTPVRWDLALDLGIGMARGLASIHARGLLHRDIKPANVVVTSTGVPKLIDFGLALRIHESEAVDTSGPLPSGATGLTSIGRIVGTPQYMAPELFEGLPATLRSDVYALGLVLRELLTGERLRWGLPLDLLAARAVEDEVRMPRVPDAPQGMIDAVVRCLRRDPAERWPGADALRDALELLRRYYRPFAQPTEGRGVEDEYGRLTASFARIASSGDAMISRFYTLLFERAPDARPLFPHDLEGQRHKLLHAIENVVAQIRAPERLVPLLEDLGRRHVAYGARREHFEQAETALIAALREHDPRWDAPTEMAWRTAVSRLSEAMLRGMAIADTDFAETLPPIPPAPSPGPTRRSTPVRAEVTQDLPRTSFVDRDGVAIAYQAMGEGPIDLVLVPGLVSHLERAWQHPSSAAWQRGLSSIARLVSIDRRGCGLSERAPESYELDAQVDDVLAVLDAVSSRRAVIVGTGDAAAIALRAAAKAGERVAGAVIVGGALRLGDALSSEVIEERVQTVRAGWGGAVLAELLAPSLAEDASFLAFWASLVRSSSSPGALAAQLRRGAEIDLTALAGTLTAPTLVVHRRGDRFVPEAQGHALAESLPRAELLVLEGEDHLPFAGNRDALLDAIDAFVAKVTR
ncbi:alpha/beta fold hydrolase [Sandaracinus amylolyticus]|uniref:alpha/beta fold hydrolase n=1 Tax=Sandaracinus amylolyticus TaxID=927083 RepID=UPI001F429CF3|nr:alpha/beta fold hydrolase [Sandaracinus amylolyticus]